MQTYGTIYADPPWPYRSSRAIVGNGGRGAQGGRAGDISQIDVESHYRTLDIPTLKRLPVADLAAPSSHLYLWATNSFMAEAHELARSWGFVPKTILTWVKVKSDGQPSMKCGHWFRSATEHVVFGVRGKQPILGPPAPTAFLLPRLPHSVKPDFLYELIEQQSPGPFLELFARRQRAGWDCWGDEVDSTITLEAAPEDDSTFTIDYERFLIRSRGKACELRNTKPFQLLGRLARRPGNYIPVERLIDDVWGNADIEKNTVQKTASSLNRLLLEAGMDHLMVDGRRNRGFYALVVK